jgi:hypothetical protein
VSEAAASSPALQGPFARIAGWRRAWLGMDRDPRVLAFVQGKRGALLLHLAFFAVLAAGPRVRPAILAAAVAVLTGCALRPARRTWLVGMAGLVMIFLRPFRTLDLAAVPERVASELGLAAPGWWLVPLVLALFLGALGGLLALQARRPASLVARRPVGTLLLAMGTLTALASTGILGGIAQVGLWTWIALMSSSLWYAAYALADRKAKDPTPDLVRLGFLRTYWGGLTTPVGKGSGYLRKFEARDEAELAATRLKALKLGVWGLLLAYAYLGLERLQAELGVATLKSALGAHRAGAAPSTAACWASLTTHYGMDLLNMAAWGHALVAMVRMAGYRIPRNSVRPLSSRTLAEFWNRYYFYFKELLVDFFFFPVFLRYFKRAPRLRLAFATLCAAGLGNFLYHFLFEVHQVASKGPLGALRCFQTYAFYCLVLSTGLVVSQLRKQRPVPGDGAWRYHVLPRLNVALFFCLLGIFDDTSGIGTLAERLGFVLHLIGAA